MKTCSFDKLFSRRTCESYCPSEYILHEKSIKTPYYNYFFKKSNNNNYRRQ